jgi:predicted nucleic acid-binding Zn ribbon protein
VAQVIAAMEEEIYKRWGDDGRRGITVKYFKQGAIAVSCTSSVWAQEIKLREKELLDAVKQKIGGKAPIERVRFVV